MSPLPSFALRASALTCTLAAGLLLTACSGNRELVHRAHEGDAAAQFEHGRRLLTGQHRLLAAPQHAPAWFLLAAEQGYAPAQAALGACYEGGLGGLTPSPEKARYWYTLAAAQGNTMAAQHLILAQYRTEKDPQRAFELLGQAADAGYLPARLQYAQILLQNGKAPQEDIRKAIDQLRIAAMDGSKEAAFLMGLFYASGLGVPQHSGIAIGWIETSAQAGYEPARELLDELTQGN